MHVPVAQVKVICQDSCVELQLLFKENDAALQKLLIHKI